MKVALYARVSKEEASSKGNLQDPENQLRPLRSYCESMGWEVSYEFIDKMSGGAANRPEFRNMLDKAKKREFELILIWALDRFSREGMTNTLSYIKQLKQYGVGLKSLQESWLDTTQEGITELLLAIFSWVAAEEKRKISERTKAGLAKLKAKGVTLGRPKGSKDKKQRTKSGYYVSWQDKKRGSRN